MKPRGIVLHDAGPNLGVQGFLAARKPGTGKFTRGPSMASSSSSQISPQFS